MNETMNEKPKNNQKNNEQDECTHLCVFNLIISQRETSLKKDEKEEKIKK